MKNKLFFLSLLLYTVFSVFAQTELIIGPDSISSNPNLLIARSSADYRVTPGDVYALSYMTGNTAITYNITVDSSYRIRVSNMGFVNGAGKTFLQLKNEIETLVANNYPLSGVQLVITQPASFNVHIRGELSRTGEISVWALSRLSSLLTVDNQTSFTSVRDVTVRSSSSGQTQVYDLFKAQRLGDLSQNPYLRPGDVITFNRVKRVVSLDGSVERPGNYQLLDGENIRELIEYYGSGFTVDADKTRVEIVRLSNNEEIAGVKFFLTTDDLANNYALENLDEITVPSTKQLQSVMFVEGAADKTGAAQNLSASSRIIVRFNQGETYASLVRRNIDWFSEVSDTQNAYILRNNQRIPINLNLALYDSTYRGELIVHENDVLIIPFRQYFVSVAGAVVSPGRYPYIPDRDWEYYIGLAGGFIPGRNTRNTVTIVDLNGRQMNKTDIITPETTITAPTNHFLFFFNQYAPVITTTLTIISSFFTVWTFLNSR
jgi:protein involved in polysaccharide export with SLBB domain